MNREGGPSSKDIGINNPEDLATKLKTRLETKKGEQEKNIELKIIDRESLITEAQKNDGLLKTAQESLGYFDSLQKQGDLKDPNDIKELNELKILVDNLEKRQTEIDQEIKIISNHPEVEKKIYNEAEKINFDKNTEEEIKESENTQKKLDLFREEFIEKALQELRYEIQFPIFKAMKDDKEFIQLPDLEVIGPDGLKYVRMVGNTGYCVERKRLLFKQKFIIKEKWDDDKVIEEFKTEKEVENFLRTETYKRAKENLEKESDNHLKLLMAIGIRKLQFNKC
ncbi:MAG: hypothetical protein PHE59_01675 [Patescibacteria group bacterium]|nr:hypothetical protein [Patescibacteria group bacterium]MDD5164483.1 hypothetical protein [Patescibacteria group bacterium]MDD5534133.1 hypothetical protein [Patescibacteria group bacterium]